MAGIPGMQGLKRSERANYTGAAPGREGCYSRRSTSTAIMEVCAKQTIAFLQPRIVNLGSSVFGVKYMVGNVTFAVGSVLDISSRQGGVVSIVDAFMSQAPFTVVAAIGSILHMQGGLVNATMGIVNGGVMLSDGTHFTHNENTLFGGAVTNSLGHAVFRNCVFTGNQATDFVDDLQGQPVRQWGSSGLGGAVFGQPTRLVGNNTTVRLQTSATFINCAFERNKALRMGAIAMVGVSTTITNCTFRGNIATRSGFDVFSVKGGTLNITNSNITIASPTVMWERLNGSQCLRGDFFDMMEGTCRRCPSSTYSLVVPAHCMLSLPC